MTRPPVARRLREIGPSWSEIAYLAAGSRGRRPAWKWHLSGTEQRELEHYVAAGLIVRRHMTDTGSNERLIAAARTPIQGRALA